MARIARVMDQENPATYEKVLNNFLRHARNKDVEAMLNITSLVTIKGSGGRSSLKADYLNDKIPVLCKYSKTLPGGENIYLPPQDGTVGWAFRRSLKARDGKVKKFQFIFLKEGGKYVVSAMSPMKGS